MNGSTSKRILSIAPMMDWTDRHFRFLMRMMTRHTTLYTEMLVDSTILHQHHNLEYFLGTELNSNPTVVQLGGNDPKTLAQSARICEEFGGFSEINLNVGCPSPKVAGQCFGARLMLDPEHVRKIVYEMKKAVTYTPITVKCRLGVDEKDSYDDLKKFISTVSSSGVDHFIVHARKCWLSGLSPAQNRSVPPLNYDRVYQLIDDFPDLKFSLNGGIQSFQEAQDIFQQYPSLEGIMIGRKAYNDPWIFHDADRRFYNASNPNLSRREIIYEYIDYAEKMQDIYGTTGSFSMPTSILIKPILSLFCGEYGGKAFKRYIANAWQTKNQKLEIRSLLENAMEECLHDAALDKTSADSID